MEENLCECGNSKKIREKFCYQCEKTIKNRFKEIMRENFDREDIEYLDEVLDGEWITDFVFGKRG